MVQGDDVFEDILPLANEYYQEIYRSSPIGIELFDEDGVLLHVNPSCLRIFGVSQVDDVLGFRLFDDPNLPADARLRLKRGETVSLIKPFDFDLIRKNRLYPTSKSGIAYLDMLIVALKKPAGEIQGYLVQVQDVTELMDGYILVLKSSLMDGAFHLSQLVVAHLVILIHFIFVQVQSHDISLAKGSAANQTDGSILVGGIAEFTIIHRISLFYDLIQGDFHIYYLHHIYF